MTGALACLQALAEGLHSRLHFYQDPVFYCPRQGKSLNSKKKTKFSLCYKTVRNFSLLLHAALLFCMHVLLIVKDNLHLVKMSNFD